MLGPASPTAFFPSASAFPYVEIAPAQRAKGRPMPEVGRGHRPLARPDGEAQRAGRKILTERRVPGLDDHLSSNASVLDWNVLNHRGGT